MQARLNLSISWDLQDLASFALKGTGASSQNVGKITCSPSEVVIILLAVYTGIVLVVIKRLAEDHTWFTTQIAWWLICMCLCLMVWAKLCLIVGLVYLKCTKSSLISCSPMLIPILPLQPAVHKQVGLLTVFGTNGDNWNVKLLLW